MTVSGHWPSPADIERAAERYRALGYIVRVVTQISERAGSYVYLDCQPEPNR